MNKIIILVAILYVVCIVVAIPNIVANDVPDSELECTNCHSSGTTGSVDVSYRLLCYTTGGKWIPDPTGHSINDGTCVCGANRYWDNIEGCKAVLPVEEPAAHHGTTYNSACFFDKTMKCNLMIQRNKFKEITYKGIKYNIYYYGLNKNKQPLIKIENAKTHRWVYNTILKTGKIKFVRPKLLTGINVFNIKAESTRIVIGFK